MILKEGEDLLALGEGAGIGGKRRVDVAFDVDVGVRGGAVLVGDGGGGVVRNRNPRG